MRRVTIEDVARASGVGRQTVSNVLNGGGRVGEATRARVLEAMTALGYHPHHGARSLRSRRTRQVAYIMPHVQLFPGNHIMQQFLQSLAAATARRSYGMLVVVPDGDPRDDMRRLIASHSVDAFLLSELQPDDPRVALLADAGIPFAGFGRTGPDLPQHWIDVDNRGAVTAAVEHVLASGFTRPSYLGVRSRNAWDAERAAGYLAGLAGCGVQADMIFVDEASARGKVRSLLTARREARPDAIVTSSDRLAAVVYSVAAELRLRIGHDLAVTGFDGTDAAGLLHPRLTSVAIPVDDIARRVVARALRQIDHGPDLHPGEIVPARLRVGESTGHDPRAHRAPAGPGRPDAPPPAEEEAAAIWKRFHAATASGVTGRLAGPARRVTIADVDAAAAGLPQTIIDDVAGGRLATRHLIDLGHRRIGFVGDMAFGRPPAGLGFTSSAHRLRGYRQALTAAGLEVRADQIRRGPHDAAAAAELAAQLLKSADPPSAIFAASDTQAIGVLAAADRLGVQVPGRLSVVGFDDIESAAFLGLSTVRQPLAHSGAEGARRLCALLRGEPVVPLRQELPLELIARASSAAYPAASHPGPKRPEVARSAGRDES